MKKSLSTAFLVILMICGLASCSTTLSMSVTRPAKLDLEGAKTIAVLPFSQSSYFPFYSNGREIAEGSYFGSYRHVNSVERQILNSLQNNIERGLMNSPYVSLVSSAAVKNALRGNIKNPADVYITGEMVTFNIFDEEKIIKQPVPVEDKLIKESVTGGKSSEPYVSGEENDEPKYIYEILYTREVLIVFNYQIVDGSSDQVLYFDTLKIDNKSDSTDELKKLPDPYSMVEYDLENFVSGFMKKLQPYSFYKSVTLLKDKTKNPDMKYADQLAKDGYLKRSYEEFYKVYTEIGQFEAGYNAAMILMVIGDFKGSEALMEDVYLKTGNSKASQGLSEIRNEIRQADILKKQINDNLNNRKTVPVIPEKVSEVISSDSSDNDYYGEYVNNEKLFNEERDDSSVISAEILDVEVITGGDKENKIYVNAGEDISEK